MPTIYLDASRNELALALEVDNTLDCYPISAGRHDAIMIDAIESLIAAHNLTVNDLTHWVVVNGPGSFTGLRIAVSLVHALDAVKPRRVLPIDSLSLLAASTDENVEEAIIDARMGEVYRGRGPNADGIFETLEIVASSSLTRDVPRACLESERNLFQGLATPVTPRLHTLRDLAARLPETAWVPGHRLTPRYVRNSVSWKPLSEQPSKLYDA